MLNFVAVECEEQPLDLFIASIATERILLTYQQQATHCLLECQYMNSFLEGHKLLPSCHNLLMTTCLINTMWTLPTLVLLEIAAEFRA
jgi:hypothetical protein